LALTSL